MRIDNKFTTGTEKLIDPISVGSIHFLQQFNSLLPKRIQKSMMKSSSKKYPLMGFVVEPYCFFLCYKITDLDKASALLPDGFKLIKTSVFTDDEPEYYCIISVFRLHTSTFWGLRTECYVIAEDEKTGLESWIIIDYDSDTISYDSKNGLRSPSSKHAVLTTDYNGTLIAEIDNQDSGRKLVFSADIKNCPNRQLDQRLWLEGNLSIGYGRVLSDGKADTFSLRFNPDEVREAMEIPLKNLKLEANTWYPGLFENQPTHLVCFPYAQHFLSDSPGSSSQLKNRASLLQAVESVDFSKIKAFSTESFRKMFIINLAISSLIIIGLIVALILK